MENLNIAIVHEWLTNVAGSEKVLLALKEILPSATIYTSVYDQKRARAFDNFEIKTTFLQHIPLMKNYRELLVPFTPFAFEQLDLSKYDIVISNSTIAAKGVITKPSTLHLSYCHTPSRYLWEPSVDPRAKGGSFSWLRDRTAHNLRVWDRLAADRVDYFLANSHYIAKRIKKYYRRDSIVVYPPVDLDNFSLPEKDTHRDSYIFVSRLVNYKKCDLVIRAFNKTDRKLRVVGYGSDEGYLRSIAKSNIEFLGAKTPKELVSEYQNAKALIFPAEEDLGIVPIEAMACGTPVVAYGDGGVTETVVPGKTGLFFHEQTEEAILCAIEKFESSNFDQKDIRRQAEKFAKEKFLTNFSEALSSIWSKWQNDIRNL